MDIILNIQPLKYLVLFSLSAILSRGISWICALLTRNLTYPFQ